MSEEVKGTKAKVKKKYTTEQMTMRVINGLYGFGEARKSLIEKEGYNYKTIMNAVKKKRAIK